MHYIYMPFPSCLISIYNTCVVYKILHYVLMYKYMLMWHQQLLCARQFVIQDDINLRSSFLK